MYDEDTGVLRLSKDRGEQKKEGRRKKLNKGEQKDPHYNELHISYF
jgi:hypothetical protein